MARLWVMMMTWIQLLFRGKAWCWVNDKKDNLERYAKILNEQGGNAKWTAFCLHSEKLIYVYKHSYWSWWVFSSDLEQRKSIMQGVWSKFCHQIVNTHKSCQHKTCNMNGQSDELKWMWAERATKKFIQSIAM